MEQFGYEEHGSEKYLVYTKKPEDRLDEITINMLINNRISGTVPASFIQMNNEVCIRYNITGLEDLKTYLGGTVKSEKVLKVIETLAEALMSAEDYMLPVSAYVLDESWIYMDKQTNKAAMIVLPVVREQRDLESFVKELIFNVHHDMTENCNYIAKISDFFRDKEKVSVYALKELAAGLQEKREALPEKCVPQRQDAENREKISSTHRDEEKHVKGHMENNPEKQRYIEVLFSEDEEEEKEEKKWPFSLNKRNAKQANKEKKKGEKKRWSFWKSDKKKGEEDMERISESISSIPSSLAGIVIPGRTPVRDSLADVSGRETGTQKQERGDASIPSQEIELQQHKVEQQNFGLTEYLGEYREEYEKERTLSDYCPAEDEETMETVLSKEQISPVSSKFMLHRRSTGENFVIQGDVIRIGRNPSVSEICISGNPEIGRTHAILYVRGGQVYIEDNGSKNKTYVDGRELMPGAKPKLLLSGSTIRLSDEELEFHISR